jgi:hypothetical protein
MKRIDLTRWAVHTGPDALKAALMSDLMPAIQAISLLRNRVLVATYVEPEKTGGGIILTQKTGEENRWQGKVGLVLKMGPVAFDFEEVCDRIGAIRAAAPEDTEIPFEDAELAAWSEFNIPQIGDWVAYRASETHELGVEVAPGICASCRIINDESIIMRLSDPRVIW